MTSERIGALPWGRGEVYAGRVTSEQIGISRRREFWNKKAESILSPVNSYVGVLGVMSCCIVLCCLDYSML